MNTKYIPAAALLCSLATIAILTGISRPSDDIISWFEADIDNDQKNELLAITAHGDSMKLPGGEPYGDTLAVFEEYEIRRGKSVPSAGPEFAFSLPDLKPFKVQAGDINGDGLPEIALCVYKTAKFHPVPAKRPFFYDLADGGLEPVWLGSRLARPFADYRLADMDGDGIDEIVSIEWLEDGDQVMAVYDWKGFGFEVKCVSDGNEESIIFSDATDRGRGDILVDIKGERHRVLLDRGGIALGRE